MRFPTQLLTVAVLALVSGVEFLPRLFPRLDFAQRIEWITYDWRVRSAYSDPKTTVATNLGAVFIDDPGIKLLNDELKYTWPWPRRVHADVVNQLRQQEVKGIGFDILFSELHAPNPDLNVEIGGGRLITPDLYFALQSRRARNVVLSVFGETRNGKWNAILPHELFLTNSLAVGHATSDQDSDGVLRRAIAYKEDAAAGRIWHMGIVLASIQLGLDLKNPVIEPGRIILRGKDGVERIIPVDENNAFLIDWSLSWNDRRIQTASVQEVLGLVTNPPVMNWTNKLVMVGSIGAGNNITDVGATPIDKVTYLVSKHWNVANSVLLGRFVRETSKAENLCLIWSLGLLSAFLTSRFAAPRSSIAMAAVAMIYVVIAAQLHLRFRLWIPIVIPLGGAFLTHIAWVTYQVVFEQREKRRVKSVFSKLVSPNVVNELLGSEKLNLGGSRRNITVFFSDVRGFTQLTDISQAHAEEYVRKHSLTGDAAIAYFDQAASDTISTVNTYLATIADQIKKHNGTLDKYMGDCVMAFWGSPTPNERHAVDCVLAAIDAQRAMQELNKQRDQENKKREAENPGRIERGEEPLPLLPLLALGTGINSGFAIVGLMGSDAHILNYTVFGREVNLASRLEGVSGRGRIIIGESTYQELRKHDPGLAATCVEQPPVTVKGIAQPVQIYEVPWKTSEA